MNPTKQTLCLTQSILLSCALCTSLWRLKYGYVYISLIINLPYFSLDFSTWKVTKRLKIQCQQNSRQQLNCNYKIDIEKLVGTFERKVITSSSTNSRESPMSYLQLSRPISSSNLKQISLKKLETKNYSLCIYAKKQRLPYRMGKKVRIRLYWANKLPFSRNFYNASIFIAST